MEHTWKENRIHQFSEDDLVVLKRCERCRAICLEIRWFDPYTNVLETSETYLQGSKHCEAPTY